MITVDYRCIKCGWDKPENYRSMVCLCGGDLRPISVIGIIGTRDNFGIKRAFIDENSHKEIDTWPKWEKAGYRQPELNDNKRKQLVKEKMKRCKDRGDRQPDIKNLMV